MLYPAFQHCIAAQNLKSACFTDLFLPFNYISYADEKELKHFNNLFACCSVSGNIITMKLHLL